jgi:outer membrane immunogenic protein
LGYAFADRWLVFVRGGAAWTRERIDVAYTTPTGNPFFPGGIAVDPTVTRTQVGWTVGTGVDWAFAPHWSANIEYNYYDFSGGRTLAVDPANGARLNVSVLKDTIHAVTTGVNYHF